MEILEWVESMVDSQTAELATSESSAASESILFLHLPKTAGTSLRNLFVKHLGEERVSKGLNMRLDEALVHYADLNAICGHFHAEQGQPLPVDRLSITVLRDPVDRFLSNFYFRKFDAQNHAVDQRVRSMDVDQFIDELTVADTRELNQQTYILYPLGTDSVALLSWPERVDAAKRALDRIDYVGIQAEIEDFVCMISARMGWPAGTTLDRLNVTSQRTAPEQLSPASRKKLESLMQYDLAIYEHAVERFRCLRRTAISAPSVRAGLPSNAAQAQINVPRPAPPRVPESREFGDRRVELASVKVVGEMSGDSLALIGERVCVHIEIVAHESVDSVTAGFLIRDDRGLPVFGTNTHLLGDIHVITQGRYVFSFSFLNRAGIGSYTVDAKLVRDSSHLFGCYHWKDKAARFEVNGWGAAVFEGGIMMDASVNLTQVSARGNIETRRVPMDATKPALSASRLNPPLQDFSARLTLLSAVSAAQTGAELLVDIEVENTGSATWQSTGKNPVCLSYHWHDKKGRVIENDGVRTCLPRDIQPGERMRLVGLLRAPQSIGAFRVIWTLVQEGVAWFDQANRKSQCSVDVTVS